MNELVLLEKGEPEFDTPAHIIEAGVRALRTGSTRYVAPEGIGELRDAVAGRLRTRGIPATAERVIVSAGAKPMLAYVMRAILGAGYAALVPDPGYPGYRAAIEQARGVAIPYRVTDGAGRFRIDVAAIEASITPWTRVLVINSPHNPTGGVATEAELDALADLALRHDLYVVSDEVYSEIVFGDVRAGSIAARPEMADRAVVIDSFSKTYAMTGWRLGYACLPASLVAPVRSLVLHSATCTPPFVQAAGIAALTGPQAVVTAMVRSYQSRRDATVAGLRSIPGVTTPLPEGAFYVFPRIEAHAHPDSVAMAERLLAEHRLACVSGASYGTRGEGHVRLSFAASPECLAEAVRRIGRFVEGSSPAPGYR